MKRLIVFLNTDRVGTLEQDDSGLVLFQYDPSWIEKPDSIPLSRSLPLTSEMFKGKKARPFFAGILPEEQPRKIIARILGISNANDFAMLERIGGECAGAVSLLPEDSIITGVKQSVYRELTEAELIQIVAELPGRPLMAGSEGIRLSLAGVQDKLPVILRENKICLPLDNTPSTHILKPEPGRFPGLAANEFFCMTLAHSVGLPVPAIEYRLIGATPSILVQRYDRRIDEEGNIVRLHQEDFCQALGFPPERKYQKEGGPSLFDCVSLIRDWSTLPVLDINGFVSILIFNVLIGNADAHGKNFSFLYSGNERRLSPYYDMVSTIAWPNLSRDLAMKIGDCQSIDAFMLNDWEKMAKKANLGWPMIRERMEKSCNDILKQLDEVQITTKEHKEAIAISLNKEIKGRANTMLRSLSAHGK